MPGKYNKAANNSPMESTSAVVVLRFPLNKVIKIMPKNNSTLATTK